MNKITRLPKPSTNYHLADDGYKVSANKMSRHKALKQGSKKAGTLTVLKRLNLIRNLTKKGSKNKERMTDDVEYLKKLYATQKKKAGSKKGSKKSTNKKGSKSRN